MGFLSMQPFVLVLLFAVVATSGAGDPTPLALADCERLAMGQNERLAAANQRWEAEQASVNSAGALPDPMVGLVYYAEEVQTRVGAQEQAIALSQMIPWPGKLTAKRRQQTELAEVAHHQALGTREQVRLQVRSLWHELVYIESAREKVQTSVELLRGVEESMRAQYRTSSGTLAKVLAIQLERDRTLDQVKTLETRAALALARLNETLGRDPAEPLLRQGDGTPTALPKPEVLRGEILAHNPGMLAARRSAAAGGAGLDLARATNKPDFTVGASWVMTSERTDMDVPGNGRDPVLLSVAMTLPIWPAKNRAVLAHAAARKRSLDYLAADARRRALADLDVWLLHHREAARREALYRQTLVPQAEQAFTSLRRGFAAGEVTFADLIDSQRRLLDLQLQAEEAMLRKHRANATIQAMRGTSDEAPPENTP